MTADRDARAATDDDARAATDDDVRAVAADAWAAVLGLEIGAAPPAEVAPAGGWLGGRVDVTGAWRGAVTLACSPALARRAAGLVFDVPADEASPDDVRDALGELTNILGGGLKALLPAPSRLSLPAVAERADWRDPAAGPGAARDVWFECEGERFVVSLRAADDAAEGAPRPV